MTLRSLVKKILRIQHKFLPLPFFIYKNLFRTKLLHKIFYKYYTLCYFTDYYKKDNDSASLQQYWLTKRSLYWHYTHLHINPYNKVLKRIYQEHSKIFINKRLCDMMPGLGSVYSLNKLKPDIIFIEANKYCCEHLRKKFPQSKVFNEHWSYIKTISDDIDTLILVSGCLIYLNDNEIEDFFKITRNIKNFVLIRDGADNDTFFPDGTIYWDLKKRLEKYNNHYKNSKIYIKRAKNIDIYDLFLMINNNNY